MTEIESLCRPVEGVYCIECCLRSGSPCYLLGTLEDGTEGCRGHNGKIFEGLTQLPFCQAVKCWNPEEPLARQEELEEYFESRPKGIYDAIEVLNKFNLISQT